MINVNEISKRYMIILWKVYASEAGAGGTQKVKNPLLFLNFEKFNGKYDQEITDRSKHPQMFCKRDVLRNLAKFTGKHFCQRLFFNKVAALGLQPN